MILLDFCPGHEDYGFCLAPGPQRASFGNAKKFCDSINMTLPAPMNDSQNRLYARAGPTWIDVTADFVVERGQYQNWRGQQRGWLNGRDGRWRNRWRGSRLDYYCVN